MSRTNSEVLAELRKRLAKPGSKPVSRQAIQQRRAKLQALVPMPTDIASYVLAQRAGVPLHVYLDASMLEQVAIAEQRLSAKETAVGRDLGGSPKKQPQKHQKTSGKTVVKNVHLDRIRVPDAALSPQRKLEAERMAAVYPMLYAFENSIREFVDGHLRAVIGKDWWEHPKIVSKGIREGVDRAKAQEGKHRYHSRRSAPPIYYANISDLATITMSQEGWPVFKPLFPSDKWLASLIERVELSRNVVAHMNPLTKKDIERIRMNFEDWLAQISGQEPPSEEG